MNMHLQNRRARDLVEATSQICQTGTRAASVEQFCEESLRIVAQELAIQDAVIMHGHRGIWKLVARYGTEAVPEQSLLADAADAEKTCQDERWVAVPLVVPTEGGWILAARRSSELTLDSLTDLEALTATFSACLAVVLRVHRAELRLHQLNTILGVSAKWNSTHDPEELLTEIAETSKALFSAEQATIFLWDRKRKLLLGTRARTGKDLEQNLFPEAITLPEDQGIAAQVIHKGEALRADHSSVGTLLREYENNPTPCDTRSLLCVPIQSSRGKVLGAFELRNKTGDAFSDEDHLGLVELASHAAIAIENSRTHRELVEAKSQLGGQLASRVELIGDSKPISELRTKIIRVAQTELPVLVLGENGTGKEVASRMIHDHSKRQEKVFVAVNCAALSESLLESELFGHEKGAFTDAHEARPGKFEAASDGTLFLDEIGELSPRAQAKLLRVLEEKNVMRVGGTKLIPTNARLIAATNRNLAVMVQDKSFREDLFFRLNVVTLEVPPLRNHREDILALATHFLQQSSLRAERPMPQLTEAAKQKLLSHPWPGNVRELKNLMERAAFLCASDQVDVSDLGSLLDARGAGMAVRGDSNLADATKEFQAQYIQQQITAAGGSMTDAAKRLGLHRSNLYRKMRQLDMPTGEGTDEPWPNSP